jgi:hypothetical protein
MLMACERNRVTPIVDPILSPNEREMIKYAPPPSTRVLVASSEMANAVGTVIRCPRIMMASTPKKPSVPVVNPRRRKRIAPRIEEMAVK